MHLFIVIHSDQKGQFYCSFQNNNGDVLAESKFYPTREACTAAQEELLGILRERSRSQRHANVFQCAQYYYCALRQGREILIRTRTSETRDGCTKYWDELMACVNGSVHRYSHTGEKERLTLPLDPKVMNYMYSLDGQGRENLANYTQEVQWEDPASWLWGSEAGQKLYHRLFQPMPRRHPREYIIELNTGIGPYAGTDARVYVTLYGQAEATQEFCLESTGADFEEGGRSSFRVQAFQDVGELTKIRVRHDNSGEEPEWYLKSVRVYKADSKRNWYFRCDRWLYRQQAMDLSDMTAEVSNGPGVEDLYEIRIRTGDVRFDAGTDAKVRVTLYGSTGNTAEFLLDHGLSRFERGGEDVFRVYAYSKLDKIERVRISHDNSGPGASWYMKDIQVRNMTQGGKWNFRGERWLAKDLGEGRTDYTLLAAPDENMISYAVRVRTGHTLTSGTAAKVFLTLLGTKGTSREFRLNTKANDFKTGKEDLFRIDMKKDEDIGDLTQVRIRHNNFWLMAGWFLKEIQIEDIATGKRWLFPCERWLAKGEDDGSIDRTLDAVPDGKEPVTYSVSVTTGDLRRAGTNAKVYVTLNGTLGTSGEFLLDDPGNDFRKGRTDSFRITVAKELGELESIRIRHDSSGLFAGWYLEKVEVRQVGTQRQWSFPCGRWLDKKEGDGAVDLVLTAEEGGSGA